MAIHMRDCPEDCLVALVGAMKPAALTAVADVTAKTLDPEAPRRERDDSNTRETPKLLRTMMRAQDFFNS